MQIDNAGYNCAPSPGQSQPIIASGDGATSQKLTNGTADTNTTATVVAVFPVRPGYDRDSDQHPVGLRRRAQHRDTDTDWVHDFALSDRYEQWRRLARAGQAEHQ
jgi:hypothetical protein